MKCKQCGSEVPAGAYKCPICGVILPLTKTKASDVFKWDVEDFPPEEANPKKVSIDWDSGKILDRDAGRVFDQTQSHWSVAEIDADPEESDSDPAERSGTQQTRSVRSQGSEGDSGKRSSFFGRNLRNSAPLFDWSVNSGKEKPAAETETRETSEEPQESYTAVTEDTAEESPVQEPVPEVKERQLSRKEKREQRRAERKKQQAQKAQASRENDIFDIPDSMKMGRFDSFLRDDYDVELVIPGEEEGENQYFTLIRGVGPVVRPPDETEEPQRTETRKKISISTDEFDWSREAEESVANRRRLAEERRQRRKDRQDDITESDGTWNRPEDPRDDHGWKSENTFRKVVSMDAALEFREDTTASGNRSDRADTAGVGQDEMAAGRFLVSRRKKQAEADTIEINMESYDNDLTPTERSMIDRVQRKHENIGGSDLSVLSLEDEYENFHNTIDYMDIEPEYLLDDSFRNVVIPEPGRNVNIRIDNGDGTTVSVRTNAVDPYEDDRNAKVSTREIDIHELRNRMKDIELSVEVSTTNHDEVEVLQNADGSTAVRTGEPRPEYDRSASGSPENVPAEEPELDDMSEGERFWANTEYPDNSNRMTITDIFGPEARRAMEGSGRKKTKKREGASILDIQPEDIELTSAQTEQLYTPTSRDDLAGIAAAGELAVRDSEALDSYTHPDDRGGTGRPDSVVHYERYPESTASDDSNLYDYDEISFEREKPLKKRRPDGGLRDGQDRKTIHRARFDAGQNSDVKSIDEVSVEIVPTSDMSVQKDRKVAASAENHARPVEMEPEREYGTREKREPGAGTDAAYYGSPVEYFEPETEHEPDLQEVESVTPPVEETVSRKPDRETSVDEVSGQTEDTTSVEGLKTSFRKRFSSFRNRLGGGKKPEPREGHDDSVDEDRTQTEASVGQIDWAATMDAVEKNSRKETVLPIDEGGIQDDWLPTASAYGRSDSNSGRDGEMEASGDSAEHPQEEFFIEEVEYEWLDAEPVDGNWTDMGYVTDENPVHMEETVSEADSGWSGEMAYAEYAELLNADSQVVSYDFSDDVRNGEEAKSTANPEWLNAYSNIYSTPETIETHSEEDVTETEPVAEATGSEPVWSDEPEIIEEYEYYEYTEVPELDEPDGIGRIGIDKPDEPDVTEVIEAEEPEKIEVIGEGETGEPAEPVESEMIIEPEASEEYDPAEVEETDSEQTGSDEPDDSSVDYEDEEETIPEESEEVIEAEVSEAPLQAGAYDAFEYYYEYYEEELIPEEPGLSDEVELEEQPEASSFDAESEDLVGNGEPEKSEDRREETEEFIRARIYEEELYEEALDEADLSEEAVDVRMTEETDEPDVEPETYAEYEYDAYEEAKTPEEAADVLMSEETDEPDVEPETYAEYEYGAYEEAETPEEAVDVLTAEETDEPDVEPETYAEYEYGAYEELIPEEPEAVEAEELTEPDEIETIPAEDPTGSDGEMEILEEEFVDSEVFETEGSDLEPETYAEYEYDAYEEAETPEEAVDVRMTEETDEPDVEPETYAEYEYDAYEEAETPEEAVDVRMTEETDEPDVEPETYAEYEYDAYEEAETPEEIVDVRMTEETDEPDVEPETYAEYEYDAYEEAETPEEIVDVRMTEETDEPDVEPETYAEYEYDAYEEEAIPEGAADVLTAEETDEPDVEPETYAEYEYGAYEELIPEEPEPEAVEAEELTEPDEIEIIPAEDPTGSDGEMEILEEEFVDSEVFETEESDLEPETYAEYEYDAYEEAETPEEAVDVRMTEETDEPDVEPETYAEYEYGAYEELIPEESGAVAEEDLTEPDESTMVPAEESADSEEISEPDPEKPESVSRPVSRVIPLHGSSSEFLFEREKKDTSDTPLFDDDYDFMKQKPENTISFDAVALNQYRKADEELAREEEEGADWSEPDFFFGIDHPMSSVEMTPGQYGDEEEGANVEDESQNTDYIEWNDDLPELSIFENPSRPRRVEAAETVSHGADGGGRTFPGQNGSAVSVDGVGRAGTTGLRNKKKRIQDDPASQERARRAEDLRSILEREEEESSGFSPLLRAAITVLIVLIAVEFAIIAVKLFAPESKPAGAIHQVEQHLSGKNEIQSPDRQTETDQESLRLSDGSLVGIEKNISFRS